MPYSTSDINSYIAKAQRAQATRMVEIVRLERLGNDVTEKYLKCRYISAAVRVLSKTDYAGLDIDEIEKIIHCMIECGDINDFDGSPLTFPPITVLASPCCPTNITDLLDGPGGSLVGNESKGLRVNSAGTAWEWYDITTSFLSLKNVVFVAKDGVDATGMVDRLDKPFLTLAAAQSAASSGYTIYVFPGTYTISASLGKSGVNWHFVDGAIVSSSSTNTFVDTGALTYSVSGNGEFQSTTGSIAAFTNGGVLTIQGKRVSGGDYAFHTSSTSKIYAVFEKEIVSPGYCFFLESTSLQDITCPQITCTGDAIGYSIVGGATLNIHASTITSSGTYVFDLTGNANIYGNIYYTGSNAGIIANSTGVACNQNFHGEIYSSSAALIIQHPNNNTGIINFYGRIVSTGGISITASTATYIFHSEITTNNGIAPSILMSAATIKIKSRVTNLDANAASYCITKTTGTLILEQAVLVTSGATECVHSAAAQTMIVYPGSVAKVAVSVNISQQVSSLLIDSQIV